jgi:hypothetical protein
VASKTTTIDFPLFSHSLLISWASLHRAGLVLAIWARFIFASPFVGFSRACQARYTGDLDSVLLFFCRELARLSGLWVVILCFEYMYSSEYCQA